MKRGLLAALAALVVPIACATGGGLNGGTGGGGATTGAGGSGPASTSSASSAASSTSGSTGSTGGTGGTGGSSTTVHDGLSCATPILVGDVWSQTTVMGTTTPQVGAEAGSCSGFSGSELVYQATAAATGLMVIELSSTHPLGVYARSVCADAGTELACGAPAAGPIKLTFPVTQGDAVFVIVDADSQAVNGPFTLTMEVQPFTNTCGNGVVEPGEECDPPAPGCGFDCKKVVEICGNGLDDDLDGVADCEDADCVATPGCAFLGTLCAAAAPLGASANGTTAGGSSDFVGSCTGHAAEAFFTYASATDGYVTLSLQSSLDLGLYARSDCQDPTTEIGCVDTPSTGNEELVVPLLANAPVSIFVDAWVTVTAGAFTLSSALHPATEIEPNGAVAQANPYADPFIGWIHPAGDEDWISVDVPGPNTSILAEVKDVGTGACSTLTLDSEVEIYGPDGVTSLDFNDDYQSTCSLAYAPNLPAGKYFVRVSASKAKAPGSTFAYRLKLSVL